MPCLGINLGKNKDTPNEEAVYDYRVLVDNFAPLCRLSDHQRQFAKHGGTARPAKPCCFGNPAYPSAPAAPCRSQELHKKQIPILVKLSPDLTDSELDDAIEAILRSKMDGIIVTNTTLGREGVEVKPEGRIRRVERRPAQGEERSGSLSNCEKGQWRSSNRQRGRNHKSR